MSSGFPGDYLNTNNVAGRSIPMMNLTTNNTQSSYRSPLAGILSDSSSHIGLRRPDLMGKRSLAEFQHHQQLQQQAAFFLRNVKHRPYMNSNSNSYSPVSPLSLVDFPSSPELSSVSNMSSSSSVPRYGVPVMRPNLQGLNLYNQHGNRGRVSLSAPASEETDTETEGKMMKRLQELEKELLLDDEDHGEHDVSGVTNSEWSETIQNILGNSTPVAKPDNVVSPSPTSSSSSSSCASSSASPANPSQLFSDAATAIADGKPDTAAEILSRLNQTSNAVGTPEQRLSFYMTAALRSRVNVSTAVTAAELYGKDHILSTQMLYDKSPCFKLALMSANATILEHLHGEKNKKLHVVDFDIGHGVQYKYLLHEFAAARKEHARISLKLTTFTDFGNGGVDKLNLVGDSLKSLSNQLGVSFSFNISTLKLSDLTTAALMVKSDEVLVVNFAFKLYKLPDESVTTENLRDEMLRRVKGLSPAIVTVVEQELNGNTASFETRVSQVCGYYGALMESLDATMGRDNSDRVKIEEGLSRKMVNSVACEGRDRVERCEVFGKWRARMSMAGFKPSQISCESLANSVTRGNAGFTAKEDSGGICFGWMGRRLTVASAWH